MGNALSKLEAAFGTDAKQETDGAWMAVPEVEGWRIKLRSQASPKVRNIAAEINRRHLALFRQRKVLPAEQVDQDNVELCARALVTAWEGFDGRPCTPEEVSGVMTDYPRFMRCCLDWADEQENYRQHEVTQLGETSAGS